MTEFDERDPQFLIVYQGEDHGSPASYRAWLDKWSERLDIPGRFGVILVFREHKHDEGEEHQRDGAAEDAISRMLTTFRNDFRTEVNKKTIGYAAVFSPNTVKSWEEDNPEIWEKVQQRYKQYAYYKWGIPGRGFTDLEEAKAWIRQKAAEPPLPLEMPKAANDSPTLDDLALFYGSNTGITEMVAEKLLSIWQEMYGNHFSLTNIADLSDPEKLLAYDRIIIGVPTWNIGKLQDDWEIFLPNFDNLDLSGKQIAMFGVGDQYGYPENYQDALGILGDKLRERGATLIGSWDVDGYEYDYSRGVENGRFLGLAIDERNQPELTESRLQQWLAQIAEEMHALPTV